MLCIYITNYIVCVCTSIFEMDAVCSFACQPATVTSTTTTQAAPTTAAHLVYFAWPKNLARPTKYLLIHTLTRARSHIVHIRLDEYMYKKKSQHTVYGFCLIEKYTIYTRIVVYMRHDMAKQRKQGISNYNFFFFYIWLLLHNIFLCVRECFCYFLMLLFGLCYAYYDDTLHICACTCLCLLLLNIV